MTTSTGVPGAWPGFTSGMSSRPPVGSATTRLTTVSAGARARGATRRCRARRRPTAGPHSRWAHRHRPRCGGGDSMRAAPSPATGRRPPTPGPRASPRPSRRSRTPPTTPERGRQTQRVGVELKGDLGRLAHHQGRGDEAAGGDREAGPPGPVRGRERLRARRAELGRGGAALPPAPWSRRDRERPPVLRHEGVNRRAGGLHPGRRQHRARASGAAAAPGGRLVAGPEGDVRPRARRRTTRAPGPRPATRATRPHSTRRPHPGS